MIDVDVSKVLSCYGLDARALRTVERLANAGGWSCWRLWRLSTVPGAFHGDFEAQGFKPRTVSSLGIATSDLGERVFCLRRWPAGQKIAQKLGVIHPTVRRIAASLPIVA